MLRQSLSQKMTQKLSPQQIQLMKLLQIPTATLDQRIQEEMETNPALEEGEIYEEVFDIQDDAHNFDKDGKEEKKEENFELDEYLNDYIEDDPITYKLKGEAFTETEDKAIPIAIRATFYDHLMRQLDMMQFAHEDEVAIAEQIVGSIDSDGYLRRELAAIADDLLFTQNLEVSENQIKSMLYEVQKMDPVGIGARDLQECLLLQLNQKLESTAEGEGRKEKVLAKRILTNYFDEFSKKHYNKLQKSLFISESQLKGAIDQILKLNPKPASSFSIDGHSSKEVNQYIIPDFIINNKEGELELSLNTKNAPDLRISDQFMDILKTFKDTTKGRKSTKKEKEAVLFVKQKIDSAKWFIDAIKQRQETLYNTMYTIMQYQLDFFKTGDERRLKPMILKDIADITSLDISTISRVANSKFVQTEFGTKRLKNFFSESLQTKDGKEVSTLEVKNILNDIVKEESKIKPLSDERLKEILRDKGYNIARRTVAKYREQLNIPVARLRKAL
ncbi:MAG: RNA polymerase factor sigma-54 [Saprospiraceae bacterium]